MIRWVGLDSMYKGDFKSGSVVSHVFKCEHSLDWSDIRIVGDFHKRNQDGVSLTENYLVEGLYRLGIDTSKDVFFKQGDYFVLLLDSPLFEFSIENRYARGTDNANTVVPDAQGAGTSSGRSCPKPLRALLFY